LRARTFFASSLTAGPRFITDALVEDLPDQAAEPVVDGADGLRMSKPRDDSSIHDRADVALGLHGGVRGLIQDPAHLAVAIGQR